MFEKISNNWYKLNNAYIHREQLLKYKIVYSDTDVYDRDTDVLIFSDVNGVKHSIEYSKEKAKEDMPKIVDFLEKLEANEEEKQLNKRIQNSLELETEYNFCKTRFENNDYVDRSSN